MRTRDALLLTMGLLLIPAIAVGWYSLRERPRPSATTSPARVTPRSQGQPQEDDETEPRPRAPAVQPRPRPASRPTSPRATPRRTTNGADEADGDTQVAAGEVPAADDAALRLAEGDTAEAQRAAEQCLKDNADDIGCWDVKLRALAQSGDVDAAAAMAKSCHQTRDDTSSCYAADLTVALARGDAGAAEAALTELQDKAPGSRFTAAAQAELSEHHGDQKDATVKYARACMQGHTVSCKKLTAAANARKAEQSTEP